MTDPAPVFTGPDGVARCNWCARDPAYMAYHDHEWGFPVADDQRLFEKICLEGFQSGLSWWTILQRRAAFRDAFANFDIEAVARFTSADADALVQNVAIIRHRGKIDATINNAARAIALKAAFGSLAAYFWQFAPDLATSTSTGPIPAQTDASRALSKDLKKRGWAFVGPTTCYAFMQAMGMVNDHHPTCAAYDKAARARAAFTPPTPHRNPTG